MDERMTKLERQFELLKYPVVRDGDVLPAVGFISDFVDDRFDDATVARARRDFVAIPHAGNREGYDGDDHASYWLSGLADYDKVVAACDRLGIDEGRYYDFGGSTGRVFRHFYCQGRSFEVWSSDFKTATFRWNQKHLPRDVRVFLSGVAPPLPVPDAHFDVVTAFSVFTHIDELESPWILELRRILRPGGLLYATIHDESYWPIISKGVLAAVNRSDNGAHITADSPFPAERTAFHWTDGSYYSCNVFHPMHYVRSEWGRFFRVVEIRPRDCNAQSVVLLTPR